ncbi:MAG: hypothetical protein HGB11_09670, partial [Chlorobiales bacterium]|nr:hypothetical protein [Chlorobiales bacterium]
MNESVLIKTARILEITPQDKKMIIGFDGFVDEIVEAVDVRYGTDTYRRLETIQSLSERVAGFANVSGNIEVVVQQKKLGGNGPIMANALLAMGHAVHYAGNLGIPTVNTVFLAMASKCVAVYSLAPAAHTDAVEFDDGKIMFTKSVALNSVTWEKLQEVVGKDDLRSLLGIVDLIGVNNWSQTIGMNDIWEGLIQTLTYLKRKTKPVFFCDLADPKKRMPKDISKALSLLTAMNGVANVILGLNKSEARQIAGLLSISIENEQLDGLTKTAKEIQEKLSIDTVVIHPIEFACASRNGETAGVLGPVAAKPRLSTGAGDNFNAGFCNGILSGFGL